MQSIKELLGCPKCGCVILPDAIKCPNCGLAYEENDRRSNTGSIYSPKPKIRETGIEAIVAYYQFTCPYHGRVSVRATVTAATIKCPFC